MVAVKYGFCRDADYWQITGRRQPQRQQEQPQQQQAQELRSRYCTAARQLGIPNEEIETALEDMIPAAEKVADAQTAAVGAQQHDYHYHSHHQCDELLRAVQEMESKWVQPCARFLTSLERVTRA